MAIFYPDIIQHNNNDYPLTNTTEVKGNAWPLATLNETGSIPSLKREVGQIVFLSASGQYYGFVGSNVSGWDTPANWQTLAPPIGEITSGTGIVSSSAFSSPSQGTSRATINGVQTDVDLGLQTGDSPTFAGLTLTNSIVSTGASSVITGSFTGSFIGVANLPDLTAGTGITTFTYDGSTTATVAVNYGSTSGTSVQGNTSLSFAGTSGEISIDGGSSITLGAGGTVTIGLADTISGNRIFSNNVTIQGNLDVSGTVTAINTANLNIEDTFILLGSGSVSAVDSGIIFDNGSASGPSFFYDSAANRPSWATDVAWNATTVTPTAYIPRVFDVSGASHTPIDEVGSIKIDSGDIFIYT